MGRQPFGLASPAAWLRAAGHQVSCVDLACGPLPEQSVREAGMIAFHLPMHTATRLAVKVIERVREINNSAQICCFGLYAPMNAPFLRKLGVNSILGGEFEQGLVSLASGMQDLPGVSLDRQRFLTPDRSQLPSLSRYAKLRLNGEGKPAGYTEASRGCKHLCRHCPIVPVYNGTFRIVQRDAVLADIRQQVEAGAEHISFGDPDFFNGPGHAIAIAKALHTEHPGLSYDVTIKIEHLLKHRNLLPVLKRTGCLFITSAAESINDEVLAKLDKGHTRSDFIDAVHLTREQGLVLAPTFIPFTPWTTWTDYRDMLNLLAELDLVENVAPIQLAIRLLIPAGSRLLELQEIRDMIGPFVERALSYRWQHVDSTLDGLCSALQALIKTEERQKSTRTEIFAKIWELAQGSPMLKDFHLIARAAIPYMTEPWYC